MIVPNSTCRRNRRPANLVSVHQRALEAGDRADCRRIATLTGSVIGKADLPFSFIGGEKIHLNSYDGKRTAIVTKTIFQILNFCEVPRQRG
jgi:hypothetical protein